MQTTTTAPPPFVPARVPDTDADDTRELWGKVWDNQNMSSRGTRRDARPPRGAASNTGRSSLSDRPSLVDAGESVGTPDSTLTLSRGITPRNTKFSDLVLSPRGITINDTNAIVPSAFDHFQTECPTNGYDRVEGLSGADIWVHRGKDWVQSTMEEYKEMKALNLCEDEFASFAKEQLFQSLPIPTLVAPPKENAHWRKPPILDMTAAAAEWSWDVRPDCAYWLSLKGFNPRYRFQIQNCVYVREWITCPYLTVESKREGISEDAAIAQVAAAGSMAMYNRYRLREAARAA
ncbi:Cell division control protein 45-like protein [Verticillium dahliae VDG2]|nr:Cell division control protein 45-like protein [Verticillium dahliae VDG2]